MPENIDYKFLSDLEGGSKTSGYVPAAGVSKSGVTIATGFDLGQRSESDLTTLGLNKILIKKLKPYLGKKSKTAVDYLKDNALVITVENATLIDKAVKSAHIASLKAKYNASTHNADKKKFSDLPDEAQTVIASVSFQYGTNLNSATPNFWKAVSSQDWDESIILLKKFGDSYPTRRKKEATLLEKIKK